MAAVLITGATRGIGLALTRQLVARGDRVVALCRRCSPDLEEIPGIRIVEDVDVTDDEALARLTSQFERQPLDVLIHNAGIMEGDTLRSFDAEAIRHQFEVNALAPLRLTQALLPNLRSGSKVVLITSRMGSIEDNSSGGLYGYRMSKAALNMVGKCLALDLRAEGIAVGVFHPGLVATRLTDFQGIDPEQAASNLIARIEGLTLDTSGRFLHAGGEPLPW